MKQYDYAKFTIADRKTYRPILKNQPYRQDLQDFFADRKRKEHRQRRSAKRHIILFGDIEKIEVLLPRDLSTADSFIEHLQYIPLYNAINKLPEIQRRRLTAHYFMGLSQREIAACEGVCEMVVSRSLAKARKNLKNSLKNMPWGD
jgi:RNA polymerase sigma-70 factor (ECF subfamily)